MHYIVTVFYKQIVTSNMLYVMLFIHTDNDNNCTINANINYN